MSEETVVVPAPEPVAAKPEVKEFRYEYQPKDEEGRPLGGKQVIVATSPEEALEKMAAQNSELVKLNRKLNRDLRLGNVVQDQIPDSAPRVREGQYDIEPIPLTAEERLEVIQNINDPENFEKAARLMVRSQIGDPDAVRAVVGEQRRKIAAMDAREQAEAFVRSTPDYYVCPDNFMTLANWMIKNDLEPVKENYQYAYDELKKAGLMLERPVAEAPASAPAPVVPAAVVEAPVVPAPAKPVSSGLTRENSSDSGASSVKKSYTQAEIDKMSGEEYKQKVLIPEFKASRQRQA